ncbi:MAG: serine/threonine protein kinase [Proteobacteria bacterium]|nr:serine/threonine protein kinase [Pseudomonadota bacterium]
MSRSCRACHSSYADIVFFCGRCGAITIQDQDPSDIDRRLGRQLGGYVIVARVADGAMGRVYEGRHPKTRARVAIKVLHDQVAKDRVAVERFKREFETARELNHPNIVEVLEFGETSDRSFFLTMEYLQGEELGKLLAREARLPAPRVLRIACQVARALHHAHSFGFIHRDLKPDNIFLCEAGEGDVVRLLDFGAVKLQLDLGPKLTAFGTTLGSPYYMAPEQALGRQDVDQQSDAFALAAIVYEMLTGRVPFEGKSVAAILTQLMKADPPPPSSLVEVPKTVDPVLEKGLAKDKSHRYRNTFQLAEALVGAWGLKGTVDECADSPQGRLSQELSEASPPSLESQPAGGSLMDVPDSELQPAAGAGSSVVPGPAGIREMRAPRLLVGLAAVAVLVAGLLALLAH